MSGFRAALRSRRARPIHTDHRSRARRRALAGLAALVLAAACSTVPMPADAASTGTLTLRPGGSASVAITDSAPADVVASAQVTVPAERTAYVAVQLRSPGVGSGYRAKVRILPGGEVTVSVTRVSGGTETSLASGGTNVTVSPGQRLNVEGSVTGSSPVVASVRAWVEGASRPGWQQTATDSSGNRITSGGAARLWGYLSGGAPGTASVPFRNATAAATGSDAPTGGGGGSTSGKPSASSTGVPSGTSLRRYDGDLTITQAGTVIDGMDIHGFVTVRAANVTIRNSVVRGGRSNGVQVGLITNYGYDNLLIDRVDVVAEYPSVYFDGIKGWDFTARNVHVVGNVDSVKIHGDNVLIQNSLLENTTSYASDPAQGGKATHNDNVQVLRGQNLRIVGNTIRGASNFAILGAAEQANVNLVVDGNWLDGGHCTLKLQVKNGWSETARVTNNKFGPNRKVSSCPFTAYPAVNLSQSGNTMELTGAPVSPLILVS